jgi:Glycosyl transferase family 2
MFSVILPFSIVVSPQFHHGITLEWITAWLSQSDFPASGFEILLAIRAGTQSDQLVGLAQCLRPQDRLLQVAHTCEADLVAAAAGDAKGEWLIFVGSLGVPEPAFLRNCQEAIVRHPQWSGISGSSIRLGNDPVSKLGEDCPWPNQYPCLVIKAEAYRSVGGLEPRYGPYASSALIGRLAKAGMLMGSCHQLRLKERAFGGLDEVEAFGRDFAAGQMLFWLEQGHGLANEGSPRTWEDRHIQRRSLTLRMLRLLRAAGRAETALRPQVTTRRRIWIRRLWFGLRGEQQGVRRALSTSRAALERGLQDKDLPVARTAYLDFREAAAQLGQLAVLRQWKSPALPADVAKRSGKWTPDQQGTSIKLGFESTTSIDGARFIWSSPEALIWLPIGRGQYSLAIKWLQHPALRDLRPRFHINGSAVSRQRVHYQSGLAQCKVTISNDNGLWLGWVVPALTLPEDARSLGLALRSISWRRHSSTDALPAAVTAVAPTYFLHVPKTMGTAVRTTMENAFPVAAIFSPYDQLYSRNELPGITDRFAGAHSFYRGHFGWGLMGQMAPRSWRVVTVLRQPQQRLISLFNYIRDLGRIGEDHSLEQWLAQDIPIHDTTLAHFLPNLANLSIKGAAACAAALSPHLQEALTHLAQCSVVGLQERPSETFLLLSHQTGSWPPDGEERVNASLGGTGSTDLSQEVLQLMQPMIKDEAILYARAVQLFEQQWASLRRSLRIDVAAANPVMEVRAELRRRLKLRHESTMLLHHRWRACDAYLGENLHGHEQHHGTQLRWTGPSRHTRFVWPLPTKEDWHFHIKLHAATPLAHAQNATLEVNGAPVLLALQLDPAGYPKGLRGRINGDILRRSPDKWHEFVLNAVVAKLPGEQIRVIGLCLLSWEFLPARMELPLPVLKGSRSLVTVIIPVKNGAHLLADTLDSVLDQGGADLVECLVQDSASCDGSAGLATQHSPRIRVASALDSSVYAGLNAAIVAAQGQWIIVLGAGDRLRPGILTALREQLTRARRLALLYGDVWMEDLQRRYAGEITPQQLAQENICQQAVIYHRTLFEKHGGFDLNYPILADYAFHLRCFGDPMVERHYLGQIIADYRGAGLSAITPDLNFQTDKAGLVERFLNPT